MLRVTDYRLAPVVIAADGVDQGSAFTRKRHSRRRSARLLVHGEPSTLLGGLTWKSDRGRACSHVRHLLEAQPLEHRLQLRAGDAPIPPQVDSTQEGGVLRHARTVIGDAG